MLGLLVVLIIAGLISLRLLPEYSVIEERETEKQFAVLISNIRAAIDLERTLGDDSPCKPEYDALIADPDNPARIDDYLQALSREHFLNRSDYANPAVAHFRWGTAPGELFWKVQVNHVASDTAFAIGSFEAGTEINEGFSSPVGWVNSMPYNDNATFAQDTPSYYSEVFDDYPGQNRLGHLSSRRGYSLKIASYTP